MRTLNIALSEEHLDKLDKLKDVWGFNNKGDVVRWIIENTEQGDKQ